MPKSMIIIGAGVAGLSAGCYGRMNGYDTRIFEMHDKPGGLCTAWERKGYTVDGCLHWLVGTGPGTGLNQVWMELGALQGQEIVNLDDFMRFENAKGDILTFYSSVDRLEEQMIGYSLEDARLISRICRAVRKFARLDLPVHKPPELYGPLDGLRLLFRMFPYMGDLRKWGRITMRDLAGSFRNPFLRQAWELVWPPEFASLFILMTLAWFDRKNAGYIVGGSMKLSRALEKRYLDLGGQVSYKAKVSKVLVEGDRAVGVRLVDGSEHRADYIVSAADGHATIFDMLEGKYTNDTIRGYYEKFPIFSPLVFIGLGVNRTFDDMPHMVSGMIFELDKPVTIAGVERKWLHVRIHNFDPTLAPSGKTMLTVMIESDYAYWEPLRKDIARYREEKEQIADTVIDGLDKRFPGIASRVEMRDVATPVTFHRYTGNWQGSYEGWLMTPQTVNVQMSRTLPGLDGFYMIGQWTRPGGGLPSGAMTGRYVVQTICKRDRKHFVAAIP